MQRQMHGGHAADQKNLSSASQGQASASVTKATIQSHFVVIITFIVIAVILPNPCVLQWITRPTRLCQ